MKKLVWVAVACLFSSPALANCKSEAQAKKLSGAALTSFMTKCEKDATTACETDSTSKKLTGAARNSHMKKCVADAVGS